MNVELGGVPTEKLDDETNADEHEHGDGVGGPDEDDLDAELEEAWRRSQFGVKVNPKRFIEGLVYSESDKKEFRGEHRNDNENERETTS
ncbi:MAG: hypothetical protein ACTSU5_08505 [Promethearchaeota archaeon]